MTVTSGTGVIFLKPKRSLSRHVGRYLSKRIIRFAFSDCTLRLSIQLLTTLGEKGRGRMGRDRMGRGRCTGLSPATPPVSPQGHGRWEVPRGAWFCCAHLVMQHAGGFDEGAGALGAF